MTDQANPPISNLLRYVTLIEAIVLVGAGGGLFFFPEQIGKVWTSSFQAILAAYVGFVLPDEQPKLSHASKQI